MYFRIIILLKLQLFFPYTIHTFIYIYSGPKKAKEMNFRKKRQTMLMGINCFEMDRLPLHRGASDSLKYGNPPQVSVKSLMCSA